jgi:CheY-like chemotaxis protein
MRVLRPAIPVGADSILIVEDDADQVYLLAELLRFEGYEVSTARSGEEGLAALRRRRFAVVLSDHRMPGKTGGAMLAEAKAAGLLAGTGVLVLTANPKEVEADGWRVLQKPVDFEVLLAEIHQATLPTPGAPASPPRKKVANVAIELVLYVSSTSPASQRARRNLERALKRYDVAQIRLEVVDLSQPDARADPDDRVAFTPTLVKRAPGTRTWLIGDLRDARALHQLFADAAVPQADP